MTCFPVFTQMEAQATAEVSRQDIIRLQSAALLKSCVVCHFAARKHDLLLCAITIPLCMSRVGCQWHGAR